MAHARVLYNYDFTFHKPFEYREMFDTSVKCTIILHVKKLLLVCLYIIRCAVHSREVVKEVFIELISSFGMGFKGVHLKGRELLVLAGEQPSLHIAVILQTQLQDLTHSHHPLIGRISVVEVIFEPCVNLTPVHSA
jgi:hypothetical protein